MVFFITPYYISFKGTSVIDMHIHTVYTDGELFPDELVEYFAKRNFRKFTITDHDSTRALDEAREKCFSLGLEFMSGCEITCMWPEQSIGVHILGYGFDLKAFREGKLGKYNNELTAMWQRRTETDIKRTQKSPIIIEMNGKRIPLSVTREEVLTESRGQSMMSGNLAIAAVKKFRRLTGLDMGMFKLGKILYAQKKKDVEEFHSYLKRNKPGLRVHFNERWRSVDHWDLLMDIKEVNHEIKAVGGIPVLAHPGEISFGQEADFTEEDAIQLKEKGIEGIEVYAPKNGDIVPDLIEYCHRYDLIATGGSDWHGLGGFEDRKPGYYAPGEKIPETCWHEITRRCVK